MTKRNLYEQNSKQKIVIENQKKLIKRYRIMIKKVGYFLMLFGALIVVISILLYFVLKEKSDSIDILNNQIDVLSRSDRILREYYTCNNKNATSKLNIVSAYGDDEAYHPKVIYFEKGFNGYKYWMAYSPYPSADSTKENPHIAVSNDLKTWTTPKGFDNPLDELEEGYVKNKMYNSDPHILYNSDTNKIEVWWRYVDDTTYTVTIYRRVSSNGVDWEDKEAVFIENRKDMDYLSPAILYENHKYKMWYVSKNRDIEYIESENLSNWSDPINLNIEYDNEYLKSWHLDVIHTDSGYEMVIVSSVNDNRSQMNLYYSSSKNNTNWSNPKLILTPNYNSSNFDNKGLYRASLLKKDNTYYLFYSGISHSEERGIGLISGKSISELCYD